MPYMQAPEFPGPITLNKVREKVVFALIANPNVNPDKGNITEIAETIVQYLLCKDENEQH